jgi:hypothetical protein
MMSRKRELKIIPKGWPCPLGECPAGLFVYDGILCVKTAAHGSILANGNEAWYGATSIRHLMVQPCEAVWSGQGNDTEERAHSRGFVKPGGEEER